MSLTDVVIGLIVAAAFFAALHSIFKNRKAGKCCGCSSGNCRGCDVKGCGKPEEKERL